MQPETLAIYLISSRVPMCGKSVVPYTTNFILYKMGEKYYGNSLYLWRYSHLPHFCDYQYTESESCEIEMSISQPIFDHKNQRLQETMIYILYKMGGNIVLIIRIYGDRSIFLLFSTKTLSWSNKKFKCVYLNQYSPRKIPQDLQDQDINPLQDGIFLESFSYISRFEDNFHSPWIQVVLFCFFYSFSLLLLDISQ